MPYKDPERKRQWEREHREERNARRRKHTVTARVVPNLRTKTSPDPIPQSTRDIIARLRARAPKPHGPAPQQEAGDDWMVILAIVAVFALMLLANLNGVAMPDPGTAGQPPDHPTTLPPTPSSGQ